MRGPRTWSGPRFRLAASGIQMTTSSRAAVLAAACSSCSPSGLGSGCVWQLQAGREERVELLLAGDSTSSVNISCVLWENAVCWSAVGESLCESASCHGPSEGGL